MKELLQNKLQRRFIVVPNEVIDKGVSAEAIVAYLLMKENASNSNVGELTLKMMAEKLVDTNADRMIKKLRPAIQELIDLELVGLFNCSFDEAGVDDFKANDTMVVCFADCDKGFFKVTWKEYRKALEASKQVKNRFGFVAYFTAIWRYTNSTYGNVAFVAPKIWKKYIADSRTLKEYNELLAENEIIRVGEDGYFTPKTGKSVGARVARANDFTEEEMKATVERMAESSGWVKTNHEQANQKRSESMKKYHENKKVQDEATEEVTEATTEAQEKYVEVQATVLVKGFIEEAYVDLRALLNDGKLTEAQYVDYMGEAQEKGFICDYSEILIQMVGDK